ncbi:hypothetical protein ERJ75_001365300 [Trypanosoma vivax]|nr:hypothetical protein TRVL_05409 [Trypanosoma vivax]KAH8608155.1 hypothetical protein ERJ75_001365300 [Trypanosoma vivax]
MALVLTDGAEKEARRIIASQNAFEVLGLNSVDVKRETILRQYEEKVAPLRRLVRNRLAMEAKAKLDHAKMLLLDDQLRLKELSKFKTAHLNDMRKREELRDLEARTRMLESRAAALSP